MVDLQIVLEQLSTVGYKSRMWQRSEVRELCNVLHADETIYQATNGHYEGGFSLLVATDTRLILVDRKPLFLTLDSIAYSMIQEVTFNYRLLNSTIHIYTSNKTLDFSSWNHSQIRAILTHLQSAMRDRQILPAHNNLLNGDMEYEKINMPEIAPKDVPTMPAPSPNFVHDGLGIKRYIETEDEAIHRVNPSDLATNSKFDPYREAAKEAASLNQRQYVRRYY
jgi:hypothetical protein